MLLLTGPWIPAGPALHAQQGPTEYQVEAAYLFNFLKFIEWPDDHRKDPPGRWVFGFLGDSPVGDELKQVAAGKSIQGHGLEVRILQNAADGRGCNVLFVGGSERKNLASILANLRGASVLTVADMDDFVESGGMVQFVVKDSRVRLVIDVGAANRAHLKISSKLLSIAMAVTGAEKGTVN
ncbi:MAG: YfiR family protein [Candidatus Acidiferrales bacterium]